MPEDFITAKAALDLLSEDGSDRVTAANALREYAAGGAIEAIAETAIEIEGCGFSNGSSGGGVAARHTGWVIPEAIWSSVERAHRFDLKVWTTGSFGVNAGYNKAVRMAGVKFDRADILAFRAKFAPFRDEMQATLASATALKAGNSATAQMTHPETSDGPVPRKRGPQWDDWIAYLAVCVAESEIFGNTKQSDALKFIADRMAKDGINEMSRATVQPAIKRVLTILEKNGVLPS